MLCIMVSVDFNQSVYYAIEEASMAMIELTMNRQSPKAFEVVIRMTDTTTTGMQI